MEEHVMKIAILTFHRACNYGAVLQAYALQSSLNALPGVQAYVLDYYSPGVYDLYTQFGMLKRKANIVKNIAAEVLLFKTIAVRNRCFADFRQRHFSIEQQNVKKEALEQAARKYDCIIVGSDQVWNGELTGNDSAFLLDFVPDEVRKFSYAASVGKAELEQEKLQSVLALLKKFDAVSLREPNFLEKFQQELPGKEIRCDVDPVFLLSPANWRSFAKKTEREPYVLFFTLGGGKSTDKVAEYARQVAREKGIRVVYASSDDRWYAFRDMEHAGVLSPEELIGLIDGAECVVTNSFHATAFSIIMHTPFFVDLGASYNSRITNLLRLTGLEERTIQSCENGLQVDWNDVDARLEKEIIQSKEYLSQIVDLG